MRSRRWRVVPVVVAAGALLALVGGRGAATALTDLGKKAAKLV